MLYVLAGEGVGAANSIAVPGGTHSIAVPGGTHSSATTV